MARNMSHNIGSHVSCRATVDAIEERLTTLPCLNTGVPQLFNADQRLSIIGTLRRRLDDYVQQKADFLAELTTEPLTTTRAARFYREVVLNFASNTLLMDTLAENEGISYRTMEEPGLRLRFRCEGKEIHAKFAHSASSDGFWYPDSLPYSLHSVDSAFRKDQTLEVHRVERKDGGSVFDDFDTELPGPLGQYFFAILENFIRNSAKHNQAELGHPGTSLEVTIDVSDRRKDPNFYDIELYDNVSDPNNPVAGTTLKQPILGQVPLLFQYLNEVIATPLVDADGHLRRTAWGLAEMRICAALLAGSTDYSGVSPINILNAPTSPPTSGPPERLTYCFKLMKPRKVCALVRQLPSAAQLTVLRGAGIYLFATRRDLQEHLKLSKDSPAFFRFFVLDCNACEPDDCEELAKMSHQLPFRFIVAGGGCSSCLPIMSELLKKRAVHPSATSPAWSASPEDIEQIEHWCWRTWCERWATPSTPGGLPVELSVFLEQDAEDSPTKEWAIWSKQFNAGANSQVHLRVWDTSERCEDEPTGSLDSNTAHVFYDRHCDVVNRSGFSGTFLDKHSTVCSTSTIPIS